ncbi:MAG: Predicted cellobiose ABC transport system, permease protein 2, partial [uncultured Friedmanniella sp.]
EVHQPDAEVLVRRRPRPHHAVHRPGRPAHRADRPRHRHRRPLRHAVGQLAVAARHRQRGPERAREPRLRDPHLAAGRPGRRHHRQHDRPGPRPRGRVPGRLARRRHLRPHQRRAGHPVHRAGDPAGHRAQQPQLAGPGPHHRHHLLAVDGPGGAGAVHQHPGPGAHRRRPAVRRLVGQHPGPRRAALPAQLRRHGLRAAGLGRDPGRSGPEPARPRAVRHHEPGCDALLGPGLGLDPHRRLVGLHPADGDADRDRVLAAAPAVEPGRGVQPAPAPRQARQAEDQGRAAAARSRRHPGPHPGRDVRRRRQPRPRVHRRNPM